MYVSARAGCRYFYYISCNTGECGKHCCAYKIKRFCLCHAISLFREQIYSFLYVIRPKEVNVNAMSYTDKLLSDIGTLANKVKLCYAEQCETVIRDRYVSELTDKETSHKGGKVGQI